MATPVQNSNGHAPLDPNDWGIITPAQPKKKKIENLEPASRKTEGIDSSDDDEWGDPTCAKLFKLKSYKK